MLISFNGWSQTFPVKGQYPSTAFPVCGADTFRQSVVPIGSTSSILVPGCDRYADTNPFYYTFTCYTAGTLGFVITPNDPADNYDWMLFDITGHIPADIYTNASMIVIGNRSGSPGPTGAINGGSSSASIECNSDPLDHVTTFASLPTLIQGHQYLLLVSHLTPSQSGYSLAFGGSTAVINDPVLPHLQSARMDCNRNLITVGMTKFVRCNSLASDGSDFIIASSPVSITKAIGLNCDPQFDMDYLQLSLSDPLPSGNYSLVVKNGTDGNTLLDDCGSQLAVGEKITFSVPPFQSTPMDSITTPVCSPNILQLVFSSPIQCSSIAADGSDFSVSGNSVVGVAKAADSCSGDLTSVIDITLTQPAVEGNYLITLVAGSDGNTLINECDLATPAGSTLPFSVKGALSASFDYSISYGCKYDTINLNYLPAGGANEWLWNIDSTYTSSLLNPEFVESVFGLKNVRHIVSNGVCSDTITETVNLDNTLKAEFTAPNEVCPKNVAAISNISMGNIVSYYWDFGDGTTSTQQTPPEHLFPDTWAGKTYMVRLIIQNNLGCLDTTSVQITKMQSCTISVPNAFTPNGDGKNDYLYPLNAFSATHLEFQVFNRYGQLVFETRDWTKKWDGTMNGRLQDTGTYIWILNYTDGSGKKISLKGSTVLIR